MNIGRILAIDYGKKRCGLANTDPLQMIASPLDTIATHELLAFVKDYHQKESLVAIVMGMPVNLDGSDTDSTAGAKEAARIIKKHLPELDIHFVDERFTSKIAMQSMVMGGMKKKKRQEKGNVDKVSAAIILQSYLESRP